MAAEGAKVGEDQAVLGDVAPEVLIDDARDVLVGSPTVGDPQMVIEHFLRRVLTQLFHPDLLDQCLPRSSGATLPPVGDLMARPNGQAATATVVIRGWWSVRCGRGSGRLGR